MKIRLHVAEHHVHEAFDPKDPTPEMPEGELPSIQYPHGRPPSFRRRINITSVKLKVAPVGHGPDLFTSGGAGGEFMLHGLTPEAAEQFTAGRDFILEPADVPFHSLDPATAPAPAPTS